MDENSSADNAATGNNEVATKAALEDLKSGTAPAVTGGNAGATGTTGKGPSMDIVLDVPVTVSLEVGRATMSVGELLKLGQGAVVELDRAVGEPLDVMVNGVLVAHGEIVLVNEKFGIRLTSVVDASDGVELAQANA